MIKVIERHEVAIPTIQKFRITCKRCHSVFECEKTDFHWLQVAHGFGADAIFCPVCATENYDWQGGTEKWERVKE